MTKVLICLTFLHAVFADRSQAEPIKVFLFGGQSNMRGSAASAPAGLRNQANVLYSYNSSSVHGISSFQRSDWGVLDQLPASGPGQFIGHTYGPELTAGKRLAEHLGATNDSPIAVVKVSRDASRMSVASDSWNVALRDNPSNDAMLRIFYEQIEAALTNPINGSLPEYEIAGMFWMQGESDANPAEGHSPAGFKAATQSMIADIRATLGAPQMPFFLGELDDFDGSGDSVPYRAAQLEIAQIDPFTHFVSTVGLARFSNDVHFNAAGVQELGQRFAEAYIASTAVPETSACTMVCTVSGILLVTVRARRLEHRRFGRRPVR